MNEEKFKYITRKEYEFVLKNTPLSLIQFIELENEVEKKVAIQIGNLILIPDDEDFNLDIQEKRQ